MACVQLHSEMALQVSRALDSVENTSKASHTILPANMVRDAIKIPYSIGI